MSLDIREEEVEKSDFCSICGSAGSTMFFYTVFAAGISYATPNPETKLQGVRDDAIIRVFSLETYTAITRCPIYKNDLEKRLGRTNCVSMIFTPTEAIINPVARTRRGLYD